MQMVTCAALESSLDSSISLQEICDETSTDLPAPNLTNSEDIPKEETF